MVTQKKQTEPKYATRTYVDSSMDANRSYLDNLFIAAQGRLQKSLEERLREGLSAIRPPTSFARPTVESPAVREALLPAPISTIEGNTKALSNLITASLRAVGEYEKSTGLRVRHIMFGRMGQMMVAKPAVSNV